MCTQFFNYTSRFSPCVFLLKAGQALHIPKGCIHAFRKLSRCELDDSDCHAELRRDYIRNLPENEEEVCISIAWDWSWLGGSEDQIMFEMNYMLKAYEESMTCSLNAKHSLLSMVRLINDEPNSIKLNVPSLQSLVLGILPTFASIVEEESSLIDHFRGKELTDEKFDLKGGKDDDCEIGVVLQCDKCNSVIFNHYWKVTGDTYKEVCLNCFAELDKQGGVSYCLAYLHYSIKELKDLQKNLKGKAGNVF